MTANWIDFCPPTASQLQGLKTFPETDVWDVSAMAGHVLGMVEAEASIRQVLHDFRSTRKRTSPSMIDAMNTTQAKERAHLTSAQVDGLAATAPQPVAEESASQPGPRPWPSRVAAGLRRPAPRLRSGRLNFGWSFAALQANYWLRCRWPRVG